MKSIRQFLTIQVALGSIIAVSALPADLPVDSIVPEVSALASQRSGFESPYINTEYNDEWHQYSSVAQSSDQAEPRWWQRFEDPLLDSLIEVGLLRNPDVVMAAKRIEIAKAAVGSATAGYYPSINLGLGYDRTRSSGMIVPPGSSATTTSAFNGSVSMSWEVDVFGRIREQVKNRKASVQVSRAERAGVKVSLEAQIATAYINLRVSQAQLEVAQIHSQSQSKVLKIAEARFEAGLASMLDVDQARVVYYNTVAMVPMLENTVHTQINAISVLLGEAPDALYSLLEQPRPLPGYIQVVAAGVPADLLRRRPDVVQAEEQIGVEATALGIAKKDWLPRLTIDGSVGTQAHSPKDLGNHNAFTYSIAPTLSWTVFDGLARKYNITAARKQMEVAIDNYNLTVLNAFQETDNALSTYFATLKYIRLLDDLVSSSRDYDRLSIDQYKNGLTAFLNVANAQMSYLENQNTLIQAQGRALTALIDLYRALGGGWSDVDLRN